MILPTIQAGGGGFSFAGGCRVIFAALGASAPHVAVLGSVAELEAVATLGNLPVNGIVSVPFDGKVEQRPDVPELREVGGSLG